MSSSKLVAFFIPTLAFGGAQKVVLELVNACVDLGINVNLVVCQRNGPLKNAVRKDVKIIDLAGKWRHSPLLGLSSFLKEHRPAILYSALNGANLMALMAKRISGVDTKIVFSMHGHFGEKMERTRPLFYHLRIRICQWAYHRADHVIAISESIDRYLIEEWCLDRSRVSLLSNPTNFNAAETAKNKPVRYDFFGDVDTPVILAVGRLCFQKNYETLIRAFSIITKSHPARLVFVGAGDEQNSLEILCSQLHLRDHIYFAGYQKTPMRWMVNADLFVTTSLWEGSPLVLLEAMTLGLKIVATDCKSGPRELLEGYINGSSPNQVGRIV